MRQAGQPEVLESIMAATVPMRGRMIHGRDSKGALYEQSQDYDIFGRVSCYLRHENHAHVLHRCKH